MMPARRRALTSKFVAEAAPPILRSEDRLNPSGTGGQSQPATRGARGGVRAATRPGRPQARTGEGAMLVSAPPAAPSAHGETAS
jgi:hypothetical protein